MADSFYVEQRGVGRGRPFLLGEDLTYAEAVALLNATCDEWESDGWIVDRGWASSGNYAAAHAEKVVRDEGLITYERTMVIERDDAEDTDDFDNIPVIEAIASCITFDAGIRQDAGGTGVFNRVESIDLDTATLVFYGSDNLPYEVRVRRVTDEDCANDPDGIIPPNAL